MKPLQQPESSRVRRVASRELSSDEVEALEDVAQRPAVPAESIHVAGGVDPADLGVRQRRRSHQRVYRATQIATALSIGLSLVAIVLFLFEADASDWLLGAAFAAGAVVLACAALWLSSRTPLSRRLRGYALAAACVSVLAVVVTLLDKHVTWGDPPAVQKHRSGKRR